MAQEGEAARPSPVEPAELGMAAGAAHGGEVRIGAGTFGVLRGDFGMLYGNAGTFAGRDDELVGLLADDPGAVYNDSGNFARQPRPGGGHAEGVVVALRGPNPGTLAEHHLRRLLLVVAMVASSVAITGLAAGRASPAAGFGFFALLLGGLSLVMIHMLRA